jgi:hypothetical protein
MKTPLAEVMARVETTQAETSQAFGGLPGGEDIEDTRSITEGLHTGYAVLGFGNFEPQNCR